MKFAVGSVGRPRGAAAEMLALVDTALGHFSETLYWVGALTSNQFARMNSEQLSEFIRADCQIPAPRD